MPGGGGLAANGRQWRSGQWLRWSWRRSVGGGAGAGEAGLVLGYDRIEPEEVVSGPVHAGVLPCMQAGLARPEEERVRKRRPLHGAIEVGTFRGDCSGRGRLEEGGGPRGWEGLQSSKIGD